MLLKLSQLDQKTINKIWKCFTKRFSVFTLNILFLVKKHFAQKLVFYIKRIKF